MAKATSDLTQRRIERAVTDPKQRTTLWDRGLRGFYCRIYPSGRKVFFIFYRIAGRQRHMKLGAFPQLTCDEARALARVKLGLVARGEDPLKDRESIRDSLTVAQFVEIYLRQKSGNLSFRKTEGRIKLHVLPTLGSRRLVTVTHSDIQELHQRLSSRATIQANHVTADLFSIFKCAREQGYLPDNHRNPAAGVKFNQKVPRTRYPSSEEQLRIIAAIEKLRSENVFAITAIEVIARTAARKSEIREARWENLDVSSSRLFIPRTKNGKSNFQRLSPPVLARLLSLPRRTGSEFIFPSDAAANEPISDAQLTRWWAKLCKEANITKLRLHDLRRNVAFKLSLKGYGTTVTSALLNHADITSQKHYLPLAHDTASDALDGFNLEWEQNRLAQLKETEANGEETGTARLAA